MRKKRLFISMFVVFSVFLVAFIFYLSKRDVHYDVKEDIRYKIEKSISDLNSDKADVVEDAIDYLERHPLESLPYLMAEISNEHRINASGTVSPIIDAPFYPGYPLHWGGSVFGGDEINRAIEHILQMTCAFEATDIIKSGTRFTDWQGWYYENYPYLYQDRPWLETNLLAKRCRINTLEWDKMSLSERQKLADKIYKEETGKCRKVDLPIKEPIGENKVLIDRLINLARQYDKLSARSGESDLKVQTYKDDVIKKGNDIIPELMYAYNRNLKNIFRDLVVDILADIKTDHGNKALVRIIYDTDDLESRRCHAFYNYFRGGREEWHRIFISLWSDQIKNNRMWMNLYLSPLLFNPYENGRTELIRFFIDQLNTTDPIMRSHIALILLKYTKQFIVIDKNTSEVTIIPGTYDQEDTEIQKMSENFYSNLTPAQLQLIIDRWNKWFADQKR